MMSASFDAVRLADLFAEAYRTHKPVAPDQAGPEPASVADAYAVQSTVMRGLGANGGFKTARPDQAKPSIMAPIPAARIRPSPARFEREEMRLVGVEIEIAFRIDSELPAPGSADYDARLREAVSVAAVIEMVDSRVADRDGASDLMKLADNQSGFGLVTGQPAKDFSGLNLTNPAITFTVDGVQTGPTSGQIPGPADAFQVLKDFLDVVGDHCGGVKPGQYVTTGALSGLHWAHHGANVAGHVEGLGDVAVTIGN